MKSPFWRSGDPFIWLAGSALACCLLMIAGLVGVIAYNGLGAFWPRELVELELADGSRIIGVETDRQVIPAGVGGSRVQLKVGSRDVYGLDFRWIDESQIAARRRPEEAVAFERREWGDQYGYIRGVYAGDEQLAGGGQPGWDAVQQALVRTRELAERMRDLEDGQLSVVTRSMEARLKEKHRLERRSAPPGELAALEARQQDDWVRHEELATRLQELRLQSKTWVVAVGLASGEERRQEVANVVRLHRPNQMDAAHKLGLYLVRVWEFASGDPRESNTEGGIFPAIFGTVMMVVLMTLAAVPFGVMAALYLREYAKQGHLVQAIRIAVNNLAGVPSIVFGMFGLGFFVYGVGAGIDQLFYADALPAPTYGTGGILWASLTLALLTVPVVVVATEEGLAAVPRELREGSLALGSTKFQMIWKVVLPSALPGILTGVILATARGAGEVAPLMITGVVKLAPDLPFDGNWPFVHLERKFMHLGFHIYDVGFQSPNVEAARPMVYATALLLLVIVLLLNLLAIVLRNRLRRRYTVSSL